MPRVFFIKANNLGRDIKNVKKLKQMLLIWSHRFSLCCEISTNPCFHISCAYGIGQFKQPWWPKYFSWAITFVWEQLAYATLRLCVSVKMQWANGNHLFSPFSFSCLPVSSVTPFPAGQSYPHIHCLSGTAFVEGCLWQMCCVHMDIHINTVHLKIKLWANTYWHLSFRKGVHFRFLALAKVRAVI